MRLNLNRCVCEAGRVVVGWVGGGAGRGERGKGRGLNVLRIADASRKVEVISCWTRVLILRKNSQDQEDGERGCETDGSTLTHS